MEKLLSKVAALGVPGLVLIVAMATAKAAGLAGGAVITTALAALGGPIGMIGGIAALGVMGLASLLFIEYGTEFVVKAVIKNALKTKSAEKLKNNIDNMRGLSKPLRLKTKDYIEKYDERNPTC